MKILYLHIGTHKTGSTSFQACLAINRMDFENKGYHVILEEAEQPSRQGNSIIFSHSLLRRKLMTLERVRGSNIQPGMVGFIRQLRRLYRITKSTSKRKFILSSEALCFCRTFPELIKLKTIFSVSGLEVKPIVVFRNRDDWEASWNDQAEKQWGDRNIVRGFGSGKNNVRGRWYFEKKAIVDFWSRIGSLTVISYEDEMAKHGSIVTAINHILGVDTTPSGKELFLNMRSEGT